MASAKTDPCRTPKDTKYALVLAMLRRNEGASGPQIAEATGWAPHTARGFLAGLSKKGISVEVMERVRQVGPNKTGAKGSYTVYHVADVPVPEPHSAGICPSAAIKALDGRLERRQQSRPRLLPRCGRY